jgi:hypothetical protein
MDDENYTLPEAPSERGWIKLHRKLTDSWIWTVEDSWFKIWVALLFKANHKSGYAFGEAIAAGQTITSYGYLAEMTGKTEKQVRSTLIALEKQGMIKREIRAGRFQLITICNWPSYQNGDDAGGQAEGRLRAGSGQPEGNLRATNKNDKNEKNEKNGETEALPGIETTTRFTIPSPAQVDEYVKGHGYQGIAGQSFCDYYEARGWMIGKTKMKSWQAAVRTWANRRKEDQPSPKPRTRTIADANGNMVEVPV